MNSARPPPTTVGSASRPARGALVSSTVGSVLNQAEPGTALASDSSPAHVSQMGSPARVFGMDNLDELIDKKQDELAVAETFDVDSDGR